MKRSRARSGKTAAACCGILLLLQVAAPPGASAIGPVWTKTWTGDRDGNDAGNAVALGGDGSVYVAGASEKASQGDNALLRKYSPSGVRLWTRTYNGPGNNDDSATGVAVGPSGNVYLTGHTWSPDYSDILLQKYAPSGAPIWSRTFDLGDTDDRGTAIAVAPDESVYVAGSTAGSWLLQKFSADGDPIWTRTAAGGAHGVAVDDDGSVCVVGQSQGALQLVKYSADGDVLWAATYQGDGDQAGGSGVAIGPDHGIVTVGFVEVSGNGHDYLLVRKYSAGGDLLWSKITPAGPSLYGWSYGHGVAIDGRGQIAVVGSYEFDETVDRGHIILRRYAPGGAKLWATIYDAPGGRHDIGRGVAVGRGGVVVATGEIQVRDGSTDLWLRKYR